MQGGLFIGGGGVIAGFYSTCMYSCGVIISVRRELNFERVRQWSSRATHTLHVICMTTRMTRALRWPVQHRQGYETGKVSAGRLVLWCLGWSWCVEWSTQWSTSLDIFTLVVSMLVAFQACAITTHATQLLYFGVPAPCFYAFQALPWFLRRLALHRWFSPPLVSNQTINRHNKEQLALLEARWPALEMYCAFTCSRTRLYGHPRSCTRHYNSDRL